MLKELYKDTSYILRTIKREFRFFTALKITFLPTVLAVFETYFPTYTLPKYSITILVILICLLYLIFTIARCARTLETPHIEVIPVLKDTELNGFERISDTFELVIKNTSNIVLENMECRFKKIHSGNSYTMINKSLHFQDNENETKTNINPLAEKHCSYFKYLRDEEKYFIIVENIKYEVREPDTEIYFEIEVSSNNFPAVLKRFRTKVAEDKSLYSTEAGAA